MSSRRGWCRLERASRELSEHATWVLVQTSTSVELVGTAQSFVTGAVGEGEFTVAEDKARLGPVMKTILINKLKSYLQARDFPSYRRLLNLQAVHLRGLDVQPVVELVPEQANAGNHDVVSRFLYQNGLLGVRRRDVAGWWPLHYASLSGNAELVDGLLRQRANPNDRTSKAEPQVGVCKNQGPNADPK